MNDKDLPKALERLSDAHRDNPNNTETRDERIKNQLLQLIVAENRMMVIGENALHDYHWGYKDGLLKALQIIEEAK
jgi:hypothetical protein